MDTPEFIATPIGKELLETYSGMLETILRKAGKSPPWELRETTAEYVMLILARESDPSVSMTDAKKPEERNIIEAVPPIFEKNERWMGDAVRDRLRILAAVSGISPESEKALHEELWDMLLGLAIECVIRTRLARAGLRSLYHEGRPN